MVDYSQLMSGVLVAATAFLGLTLVHLGQPRVEARKSEELRQSRRRLSGSFLAGIFAVIFAIVWFVIPSCFTILKLWGITIPTIALLFQINLFWPEVWLSWTSTQRK